MLKFKFIFFVALLAVVMSSCKDEVETYDAEQLGLNYYPMELGSEWIYKVDSIVFDNEGADVYNYSSFLKELVAEKYTNEVGDTTYRLERYYKSVDSADWQITDVWATTVTPERITRTEENLKFVTMVFPTYKGQSWEGNVFIDQFETVIVSGETVEMFKNWDYRMLSVDESDTVDSLSFDRVMTISQADDENSIERRFSQEKYARNVGLIYKEQWILDTQEIDDDLPWEAKAWSGFILTQKLISYN